MSLTEINKPNNTKLWQQAIEAAKCKFKNYPSAYADLWAFEWYMSKGGTCSINEVAYREEAFLGKTVIDQPTGIEYKITAIEFPFTHSDKGQFNIYNAINSSTGKPLVDRGVDALVDPMKEVSVCETCAKALLEDLKEGKIKLEEAEYQGREVNLGKPFRTPKGPKKFSVYVRNKKGNVVKVNFGDPGLSIKRDDPKRKKAFRARHKCSTRKDRTKPSYWSCRFWSSKPVSKLTK